MAASTASSSSMSVLSEANRIERNRASARRSRASFAVRRDRLEARRDALEEAAESWTARCRAMHGDARTEAATSAAAARARDAFVPTCPPRRKPGSRTAVSDEELERLAAQGDAKAQRMLSNRSSARHSRQKRWDEYNGISRRVDELEAVVEVLASMCSSASPDSSSRSTEAPSSPPRNPASPGSPFHGTSPECPGASVVSIGTADAAAIHDRTAFHSAVKALGLGPSRATLAASGPEPFVTSPVDSANRAVTKGLPFPTPPTAAASAPRWSASASSSSAHVASLRASAPASALEPLSVRASKRSRQDEEQHDDDDLTSPKLAFLPPGAPSAAFDPMSPVLRPVAPPSGFPLHALSLLLDVDDAAADLDSPVPKRACPSAGMFGFGGALADDGMDEYF